MFKALIVMYVNRLSSIVEWNVMWNVSLCMISINNY